MYTLPYTEELTKVSHQLLVIYVLQLHLTSMFHWLVSRK